MGKPTLTFSPSMAVHAHWGFLKLDSASISVTAAESLTFGAVADAGAHCSTSSPGIGLFPHPVTLGTFDIQVGPVPVTVTPKLQLYLSGQATIEAKATFSLEQGASVTVGAVLRTRLVPSDQLPEPTLHAGVHGGRRRERGNRADADRGHVDLRRGWPELRCRCRGEAEREREKHRRGGRSKAACKRALAS